jgi:hypothetical protein
LAQTTTGVRDDWTNVHGDEFKGGSLSENGCIKRIKEAGSREWQWLGKTHIKPNTR